MLEMSENDIHTSRVVSQNDLDKSELEWLEEK